MDMVEKVARAICLGLKADGVLVTLTSEASKATRRPWSQRNRQLRPFLEAPTAHLLPD